MVHHHLEDARGPHVLADLRDHVLRTRGVVDHAERVDQIVGINRNDLRQLLGVRPVECDAVLQAKHRRALPGQSQRLLREIHRRDAGPGPGEADRVRSNPAADLQDLLPVPPFELGEPGDVRLHEVLPGLNLLKILAGSDLAR